jgi:type I restriction-modification system DNA methylase subunit
MIRSTPSEKDTGNGALEKRLWDAADQFRANSGIKSKEYSAPVLGLIFLRFAEVRFATRRAKLEKSATSSRRESRLTEQVHTLERQSQNLRRTRDLLLPRLLSGQVELKTEAA